MLNPIRHARPTGPTEVLKSTDTPAHELENLPTSAEFITIILGLSQWGLEHV